MSPYLAEDEYQALRAERDQLREAEGSWRVVAGLARTLIRNGEVERADVILSAALDPTEAPR